MNVIVCFFDILTMIISAYWALVNIKKLKISTRYIIYFTFFVICIVPLFMDYIIGKPMYELLPNRYHGFVISYDDSTTRILYDIFLVVSQYIILKCFWRQRYRLVLNSRPKQNSKGVNNNNGYDFRELNRTMQRICVFVALIAPVIAIVGGYTIVLFDNYEEESLFRAISKIKNMSNDSRNVLEEAALHFYKENCTEQIFANNYIRIINEIKERI